MATFKANSGLVLAENGTQPPGGLWRPWAGKEETPSVDRAHSFHGDRSGKHPKTPHFVHPVRLFWPKTRCFDYLYRDAEMLLRNYPVQATICLYDDSSSDEDSDNEEEVDEEEEKTEKELK